MRVIFRTCRCARGPIGSPDAADVSCVGGGGGGGRVLIFAVLPPAYPRRHRRRRRKRAAPLARTADRVSAVPRGLPSLIRVFHRFRTVLAVRRGPESTENQDAARGDVYGNVHGRHVRRHTASTATVDLVVVSGRQVAVVDEHRP